MAAAVLNPYLTFQNQAKEAMEFYHSVLGGELKMTTFGEGHMSEDEGGANLIMHAVIENGPLTFMASDGGSHHPVNVGDNMSMSLSGDDEEALTNYFNKLSEGGKVDMPLEKAPWGDQFGMFTDKFGIHWMVNISGAQAPA
jgi:PhnB protein